MSVTETHERGEQLRDLIDQNPMVGERKIAGKRFWTGREQLILRAHYPTVGLAGCLPLLPGRSASSIYQQCRLLGLVSAQTAKERAPRQQWTTSDAIDSVICAVYPRAVAKCDVAKLARTVGRPRWWVSRRASKLGLVQIRFREGPWAEREIEIVSDRAHQHPASIKRVLAREGFKRTETAISVKIKRIGLSTEDPNYFTARGLASAMGVDAKAVTAWISKGWLKAKHRGTERVREQGGDQWWIHRKDVRKFIIENAAAVDIRKVEKVWFIELLAGGSAT